MNELVKSYKQGGRELSADEELELEQKIINLKKKYQPLFTQALGSEKVNQLYAIERKFKEKLREILEQRMQQRNNPALGPGRPGPYK